MFWVQKALLKIFLTCTKSSFDSLKRQNVYRTIPCVWRAKRITSCDLQSNRKFRKHFLFAVTNSFPHLKMALHFALRASCRNSGKSSGSRHPAADDPKCCQTALRYIMAKILSSSSSDLRVPAEQFRQDCRRSDGHRFRFPSPAGQATDRRHHLAKTVCRECGASFRGRRKPHRAVERRAGAFGWPAGGHPGGTDVPVAGR